MSASATSIADVLTVRPATAEPGTATGTAPAVDFSVIVALLQRALQASPVPATLTPGATPAGDPAGTPAAPTDAQVTAAPAPPPLAAPSAQAPVVALVPAAQPPAPEAIAMPADVDPRPLTEAPRRARDLAIPVDAAAAPHRTDDELRSPGSDDEPANDERAIAVDPIPGAAAQPPAIAMPSFVPPMPVAPVSVPAATNTPGADASAQTASRVEAFGGSASPFSGVPLAPPARPSLAPSSRQAAAVASREATEPMAPASAAPMPSSTEAAEAAASRGSNAAPGTPAPDPAASVGTAPAAAATSAAAAAFAAAPAAIPEPIVGTRASVAQDTSEPAPDATTTADQPAQSPGASSRATRAAKAGASARLAPKAADPAAPGGDATAGRPAAPRPAGTPVAPLTSEAEAPAPSSRDAVSRPGAMPGALPSRAGLSVRDGASVSQADTMPHQTRTLGEGAAAYDAGLVSTRDVVPGVRRVRAESVRAGAVREIEPSRVADRGVQDAALPEAGAIPIDAFAATTRATATDEPARPDEARMPVVDQIVTRVKELKGNGHHEIWMRLDPPDLGGVTIDARLDGARLTVHIRAEHGATQEMLADALPRLRESLTQQGFVTDQINVQLSFDATGGGAFRDGTARDDGRPFAAPAPASPPPAPPRPARATVPTLGRAAHGGLDVWA